MSNILPLAPPATIDFCINLDRDFEMLVVSKLGETSRLAYWEQADPATMTDTARLKIQREIMQTVFGISFGL